MKQRGKYLNINEAVNKFTFIYNLDMASMGIPTL